MTVPDDAPRDENGDRLAVDEDKRTGGAELANILADIARNAAAQQANTERRDAELALHRGSCVADECRTCERVKCYRCGATMQGLGGLCDSCRDRERFERAKIHVFASIPRRFRWALDCGLATLNDRVQLPAERIAAAVMWAGSLDAVPPSLALVGATGAGKTSLVVALFATWFAKHREQGPRFVTAIELGLARARHPLGHGDPEAVTAAISAPLLILDDLGAEAPMHSDVLRQVLHQRHNDDLPTWVTTGLTRTATAQRYDAGLARRLFEESKHVPLGSP